MKTQVISRHRGTNSSQLAASLLYHLPRDVMPAVVPKLSQMEDTLRDMCKRILGFIIKMTSGVVYSIVIHYVIITAYALAIFRICYTNEYDLDELSYVLGPTIFVYPLLGLAEVGVRWFYNEDSLFVTKSGHFAHCMGCWMLILYMIPSNPIEGLLFFFVGAILVFGTFFVLLDVIILSLFQDEYLTTQPLV